MVQFYSSDSIRGCVNAFCRRSLAALLAHRARRALRSRVAALGADLRTLPAAEARPALGEVVHRLAARARILLRPQLRLDLGGLRERHDKVHEEEEEEEEEDKKTRSRPPRIGDGLRRHQ